MFWNYRLLKTGEGDDIAFTLVEAYYDEKGAPNATAYADPHELVADSPLEMKQVLERALIACDKPPITVNAAGGIVEVPLTPKDHLSELFRASDELGLYTREVK